MKTRASMLLVFAFVFLLAMPLFQRSVTVQAASAAQALPLAVDYLVNNYNATVGLIPEVPNGSTYWLYSDNFLAAYALWCYDPSNSTLANIVTNISSTISRYIRTVPNPLNQYMVLNSSVAAFNGSKDYTIGDYGDAVIGMTLNNETGALSPSDYADIAFLNALYYNRIGQVQNASDAYQIGASMFNGYGLNDTVFQTGSQTGQYQTYKLALYVYAGIVLGQQFSVDAETTLLKMQAASGGFYTGYDESYLTNGTNTNVETTSLAILALLELGETIYINADGGVTPLTAPIYSVDNVTYTLTGDITAATNGILIQRNNVVLNGAGYTVTGSGSGSGVNAGINVTRQSNVTIANMTIENFGFSIDIEYSSNCTLSGNTVTTSSRMGSIILDFSDNDILSGNTVTANPNDGIVLASCSNDTLSGNDLTNNNWSIYSDYSSNNTLSGNNFANNTIGINFASSSNNTIYDNNFLNNTYAQVYSSDSTNVWDKGSVGNYWSDYLTNYPNATQVDSSGVWNTPYVIDANNTDYYPLVAPYSTVPEFPSFLILPLFLIATLLAVIIYKKKDVKTRVRA